MLNLAAVGNNFKKLKIYSYFSDFIQKTPNSSEKSQNRFPKDVERVIDVAKDPINDLKEVCGCIGTGSKCVTQSYRQHLETVANTASNIADICKCVFVIRAVFQVAAFGANSREF